MNDKRVFIITEDAEKNLVPSLLNEAFCPSAEKVLAIKSYLDANFSRQVVDEFNSEGYPTKTKCVMLLSNTKEPLKSLTIDELLRMLDDKFQRTFKSRKDRELFLRQVIKDWYNNRIKSDGLLSVNHL